MPSEFRGQTQIMLKIGHDMPKPIPDLVIDDEGFSGTLSFHEQPSFCKVPWSAVFAVDSDHGAHDVWVEAMPPERLCDVASP